MSTAAFGFSPDGKTMGFSDESSSIVAAVDDAIEQLHEQPGAVETFLERAGERSSERVEKARLAAEKVEQLGSVKLAARELGIPESTLRGRLKQHARAEDGVTSRPVLCPATTGKGSRCTVEFDKEHGTHVAADGDKWRERRS